MSATTSFSSSCGRGATHRLSSLCRALPVVLCIPPPGWEVLQVTSYAYAAPTEQLLQLKTMSRWLLHCQFLIYLQRLSAEAPGVLVNFLCHLKAAKGKESVMMLVQPSRERQASPMRSKRSCRQGGTCSKNLPLHRLAANFSNAYVLQCIPTPADAITVAERSIGCAQQAPCRKALRPVLVFNPA